MTQSVLQTGPSLLVKIFYVADNTEKLIGFASGLNFQVTQGQKPIFVVDSPFPAEIAQAAAPSMVRGSMTLFLPKGSSPEAAGLVAYRTDSMGDIYNAASKYLHLRIYDRVSTALIYSMDYTKVSGYSVNIRTRSHVQVQLQFESLYCTPGNS
jgi:hypothetical protein